jgi:hypothetical protein
MVAAALPRSVLGAKPSPRYLDSAPNAPLNSTGFRWIDSVKVYVEGQSHVPLRCDLCSRLRQTHDKQLKYPSLEALIAMI